MPTHLEHIQRRKNENVRDVTEEVKLALLRDTVSVIRDASLYRTDRPHHAGGHGSVGTKGDSELEAGLPSRLGMTIEEVFRTKELYWSLNNIRIFGPISEYDYPHYHGYSRQQLAEERLRGNKHAMQVVVIMVQAIAPYDETTQAVYFDEPIQTMRDKEGNDALIVIYEENGILKTQPLETGDMVVLPSGAYHTFSALPGVYASYAAIEISDAAEMMYQTHFMGNDQKARGVIANTVEAETGQHPEDDSKLTLADVPSLRAHVHLEK